MRKCRSESAGSKRPCRAISDRSSEIFAAISGCSVCAKEKRWSPSSLLVVEQNATRALQLADRGYILRTGHLVAEGSGADLAADQGLFESFIGGADGA